MDKCGHIRWLLYIMYHLIVKILDAVLCLLRNCLCIILNIGKDNKAPSFALVRHHLISSYSFKETLCTYIHSPCLCSLQYSLGEVKVLRCRILCLHCYRVEGLVKSGGREGGSACCTLFIYTSPLHSHFIMLSPPPPPINTNPLKYRTINGNNNKHIYFTLGRVLMLYREHLFTFVRRMLIMYYNHLLKLNKGAVQFVYYL